jgi:transposase-like protein
MAPNNPTTTPAPAPGPVPGAVASGDAESTASRHASAGPQTEPENLGRSRNAQRHTKPRDRNQEPVPGRPISYIRSNGEINFEALRYLPLNRFSPRVCALFGRRCEIVTRALFEMARGGRGLNETAKLLQVSPPTLHRWLDLLRVHGPWGLLDGTGKTDGPTVIARLGITQNEIRDIAKLAVCNGYTGAYRIFSMRRRCRPELARYLQACLKRNRRPALHLHRTIKAATEARKARRAHGH